MAAKKFNYTDIIDKNTPESDVRLCCFKSCANEGGYPAPKSKNNLQQRYWFCLEHVRSYNAAWNYFQGMNEAQIQSYQKEALAGHRPTWKIGMQPTMAQEQKIIDKLSAFFSYTEKPVRPALPTNERNALAVLNLTYPVTLGDIKKRYKELVKQHHPDVNNSDKHAEEKFITISTAYHFLLNCGYFTS
jgi:hypothetical protein